ncbi:hypothetical protein AEAC466_00480 [Asticcacaulis sp. AC466]|nr:hypothetical protein AEAC466_00480 [Asticcacaulis sp. AC466]
MNAGADQLGMWPASISDKRTAGFDSSPSLIQNFPFKIWAEKPEQVAQQVLRLMFWRISGRVV